MKVRDVGAWAMWFLFIALAGMAFYDVVPLNFNSMLVAGLGVMSFTSGTLFIYEHFKTITPAANHLVIHYMANGQEVGEIDLNQEINHEQAAHDATYESPDIYMSGVEYPERQEGREGEWEDFATPEQVARAEIEWARGQAQTEHKP